MYSTDEWSMTTMLMRDELYIYKLSLAHIERLHACRARVPKKKIVTIVNDI